MSGPTKTFHLPVQPYWFDRKERLRMKHPDIRKRARDFYSHTSNDLLLRLAAKQLRFAEYYQTIVQTVHEVQDVQNSPAISMTPHLIVSRQMALLRSISVYSERGDSPEQVRRLYMNQAALSVWKAMGKPANIVGSQKRPPVTASLAYGVPFST